MVAKVIKNDREYEAYLSILKTDLCRDPRIV